MLITTKKTMRSSIMETEISFYRNISHLPASLSLESVSFSLHSPERIAARPRRWRAQLLEPIREVVVDRSEGGEGKDNNLTIESLAYVVDADLYLAIVNEGPSRAKDKIRDDAFRTFKHDAVFRARVDDGAITRVLNAIERFHAQDICCVRGERSDKEYNKCEHEHEHKCNDRHNGEKSSKDNIHKEEKEGWNGVETTPTRPFYVQGMNVLLAPILYVMESEVESFYCFYALITRGCPRYVSGNLEGVHNACALLTECLGVLDKELSKHIGGLGLDTIMFAFSPLMTLLASLQPLEEVLVAWDFLFLAGPHFAVLLYANHLILMRTTLIQLNSAFKVNREISSCRLDAAAVIAATLRCLPLIPHDLLLRLARHPIEAGTKP